MKTDPLPVNLHPQARRGIELFNRGKYYKAHDPLEEAWMETPSPQRDLYQGILQISLAYYQISRGNFRGALKMFKRGQRNLDTLGDSMLGINVRQLQENALYVELRLRDLGENQMDKLSWELFKPIPIFD